jgi:hypothetical protein
MLRRGRCGNGVREEGDDRWVRFVGEGGAKRSRAERGRGVLGLGVGSGQEKERGEGKMG